MWSGGGATFKFYNSSHTHSKLDGGKHIKFFVTRKLTKAAKEEEEEYEEQGNSMLSRQVRNSLEKFVLGIKSPSKAAEF